MAVFVDHPCKVGGETIIDQMIWSTCDPIAALSSSQLDENEKEKFQVLFVNDEVKSLNTLKTLNSTLKGESNIKFNNKSHCCSSGDGMAT